MHWLVMLIPVWILFSVVATACYLFGARIGYDRAVDEFEDAIQKGMVRRGDSQQRN